MDSLRRNIIASIEDLISETSKCRIAARIETCLIFQCHVGKDHVLFSSILRQEYCRFLSHNEDNKRDRRRGDSREKVLSKTMHANPLLTLRKAQNHPCLLLTIAQSSPLYPNHSSPQHPTHYSPAHHPPTPSHPPPPSTHHSLPRSPRPTPPQPSD